MDCIICQDTGQEPLQENTSCSCKYKRHISCWIDYVHSKDKLSCPMCRTDLSVKSSTPPLTRSRIPYTPQIHRVETHEHQITYQEFNDIIHQNTVIQVIQPSLPVEQPVQNTRRKLTSEKTIKILLCIGVLVTIVILFWIFI